MIRERNRDTEIRIDKQIKLPQKNSYVNRHLVI